MNNSKDTRNILICIAEAVIISLCVIAAGIYIKYLDYSTPTFYFCDARAVFDHSIIDTSGKEYPEGTEFGVYIIDSYGRLSLRVAELLAGKERVKRVFASDGPMRYAAVFRSNWTSKGHQIYMLYKDSDGKVQSYPFGQSTSLVFWE